MQKNLSILILLATCWSAIPLASAQETTEQDAPLSDASGIELGDNELSGAAADEAETFREQTIYIPYEKLRNTFEKQGRGVFLPYEKFQELWNAARDKQPLAVEDRPPVKALITEISNEATVSDDVLRVEAELSIDLLDEGWIEVPIGLADAAVLSATIDDKPARLVPDKYGQQTLLVKNSSKEPTEVSLKIEYAKSLTKSPGRNLVEVAAPRAPVNRWRLKIPESRVKVNVSPLLAASEVPADDEDKKPGDDEDPEKESDETVVLAFVGATPTVRFDWTPRMEGATGLDALVSVQARQRTIIDQGVSRTTTWLDYEISRSELSELNIKVPADQKVVNVIDANVRQWDVKEVDGEQQIVVGLFEPASGHQTLVVELEKFQEETEKIDIASPVVEAINVGRQRGQVVVRLANGLRAEATDRAGLSQLDANEIAPQLANQEWDFSYRYSALPYQLQLAVEEIQPRITVDQLVKTFIEPQKLTMQLRAKYKIERAGVFELRVNLPEDDEFEIRNVRGMQGDGAAAVAVESHTTVAADGDTPKHLVINLSSKATGIVGLFVELERRLQDANLLNPTGEPADLAINALRVAPEGIENLEGHLLVYAPENLRIAAGDITALRTVGVEEAFQGMASARNHRFGNLRPVLSYAFAEQAPVLNLAAERRKPQVTADQTLIASIEPGVIKYTATIHYSILYSGVKTLRVDIPQTLVDSIRNVSGALRETPLNESPDGTAEDYVAWELRGESELLGQHQLRLTWETPISDFGIGQSVDLIVPRIIPQDVDRAEGQIVLAKAESIEVMPSGDPTGLDPIDPQQDLRHGVRIANAAQALEFQNDDWTLTVAATRYTPEILKHTSIEHGLVRTVVTRSDRVACQALYRMRSNQQRIGITLPREVADGQIEFDTEPLRINGRPVSLERGEDKRTFYVPLVSQNADAPFLLELRYTMPGDGQRIECPHFPAKADIQPAVQKVDLVAYVPRERRVVGVDGPWTNDSHMSVLDFTGWHRPIENEDMICNRLTRGIAVAGNPLSDFQVDGRPYRFSTLHPEPPDQGGALRLKTVSSNLLQAIVFGAALVLGLLLVRESWTLRIVWLLAAIAALVLVGLFFPSLAIVVLDQPLAWAALLVAILWIGYDITRVLPRLGEYRLRWPKAETKVAVEGGSDSV